MSNPNIADVQQLLSSLMESMKDLSNEERPAFGKSVYDL